MKARVVQVRSLEHVLRSVDSNSHTIIFTSRKLQQILHFSFFALLDLQLLQKCLSEWLRRSRVLTCDQIASDDHLLLHSDNRDDEIR